MGIPLPWRSRKSVIRYNICGRGNLVVTKPVETGMNTRESSSVEVAGK